MSLKSIGPAEGERSPDDREYVRFVCETGDEDAFLALLQGYRREAASFARRKLRGSEVDAEDVLQQANINALHGFRTRSFDPSRRLHAWYFTVISNAAIDFVRRNHRHDGVLSLDRVNAIGEDGAELSMKHMLMVDDDPARHAETDETRAEVRRIIRHLSDRQREAIDLLYWKGYSYRELADRFGIPEGTVKSCLHAGKRRLRELLVETEEAA